MCQYLINKYSLFLKSGISLIDGFVYLYMDLPLKLHSIPGQSHVLDLFVYLYLRKPLNYATDFYACFIILLSIYCG